MSRTIDEKVVSLQFDNADFERNVKTSISTLEKFQNSLKMKGAEKGLENVEKAAKNLDSMAESTNAVSKSFSALEIVAINVLSNIANQAVQTGIRLAKSLSTDQIMDGYGKYEEKVSSVQTLVNATGKSMDEINGYLATLMKFSDETSYGFSEMASSLGQLASSGGDVEKLIPMIMGIANATAFAGKSSAEFSRAIYNLNQSYGSGALKYMDWKSLELAGVASKQLKESFIETAIELGELTKEGETAKGTIVDIANFGQTLKDNWATTEVMEQTFGKFYQYTQMADEMVAEGIVDTYTAAYKKMLEENPLIASDVYYKAARAAQEATTFSQAITATKDAVSSGWMSWFEILFGDYDRAKKTWSDLAEDLYTIFAEPGNTRNDIFGRAFKSGYEQLKEVFRDADIDIAKFSNDFEKYLDSNGYNIDELIVKYGSLDEAINSNASIAKYYGGKSENLGDILFGYTESFLDKIYAGTEAVNEAGDAIERVQSIFDGIWKGDYGNGETRVKKLAEAQIDYATAQGLINKMAKEGHRAGYKLTADDIAHLTEEELKNLGATEKDVEAIESLKKMMDEAGLSTEELIKKLTRKSGRVLLAETINNITQSVIALKKQAGEAWSNVFDINLSEVIYRITERVHDFSAGILKTIQNSNVLTSVFDGVFSVLKIVGKAFSLVYEVARQLATGALNVLSVLFSNLNIDVSNFSLTLSDALDYAIEWLQNNEVIISAVEAIAGTLAGALDKIKTWIESFSKIEDLTSVLPDMVEGLKSLESLNNVLYGGAFEKFSDEYQKFVETVKTSEKPFESIKNNIGSFFTGIVASAGDFKTAISSSIDNALGKLKLSEEEIQKYRDLIQKVTETGIGLGAGYLVLKLLTNFSESAASLTKPLKSFSNLMEAAQGSFYALTSYINAQKANITINNILKIAIAVGIITAALYALAKVGSSGDLWTAVLATGALLAFIAAFAWAISTIAKTGISANSEKAEKAFANMAKMLLAMGGSLLLIAFSLKVMDGLYVPKMMFSVVMLVILMSAMSAAVSDMNKTISFGGKDSLWSIIGFAIALRILAGALSKLDEMDFKHGWRVFFTILGLILTVLAVSRALKGVSGWSSAVLIGFASSMLMLITVLKKLSVLEDETYLKGLLRMIPIFGAMWSILKIVKGMDKSGAIGAAAYIVGASVSVFLMGFAIQKLAKLTIPELIKGGGAAVVLMLCVAMIGALVSRVASLEKGTIRSAIGVSVIIVTAAASLYIMAGAILIFKNMDKDGLWRSVGVIGVLFGAIGGLIWLIGKSGLFYGGNTFQNASQSYYAVQALTRIAIIIAVLAASLLVLSFIPQSQLLSVAGAIGAVMLCLSVLTGVLSLYKSFKDMSVAIVAVAGILASVGAVIYVLTTQIPNADKAVKIAQAISETMLAVSGALLLVSIAAKVSTGLTSAGDLIVAFGQIAGVVLALASIITIIEELFPGTKEGVEAALDNFVLIMQKIGEAFGGLIGYGLGSIITGFTESLDEAATVLKRFCETMQDIFSLTVPETFSAALQAVIDVLMAFGTRSTYIQNIADQQSNVGKLKAFFAGVAKAVTIFSDQTEGIDVVRVNAAGKAVDALAKLNDSLSNSSGWFKDDIEDFGKRLEKFGGSLVTFSYTLGGFNQFYVEDKLPTIQKLFDLELNMNDSWSLWGWVAGGNQSLGDFGTRIQEFGAGLANFSTEMMKFRPGSVDMALKAGEALAALESGIQNSSNLKGVLYGGDEDGNKNLGDFGFRIKRFAQSLVEGLNELMSLNDIGIKKSPMGHEASKLEKIQQMIDPVVEIAGKFAELENSLNGNEALLDNISGKSEIQKLGEGLGSFASGMKDFSDNFPTSLPTLEETQSLMSIVDVMAAIGLDEKYQKAADVLPALGNGISGMISSTKDTIANMLNSGSDGESLLDLATQVFSNEEIQKRLSGAGATNTEKYLGAINDTMNPSKSEKLKETLQIVENAADSMVKKMDKKDKFFEKAVEWIQGLIEGMESKRGAVFAKANEIMSGISSVFSIGWDEDSPSKVAHSLGSFFVMGLTNGIDDQAENAIGTAEEAAYGITKAVASAMAASNDIMEDSMSPMISPVLDLSNIERGSSMISDLLGVKSSYDAALSIGSARMYGNQNGAGRTNNITINASLNIEGSTDMNDPDVIKGFARKLANEINVILGNEL